VRELRNAVERLSLLRPDDRAFVIDAAALLQLGDAFSVTAREEPIREGAPSPPLGHRSLRDRLESYERGVLEEALAQAHGNVASAARLLQMDRGNLHRRLRALGVAYRAKG
jgi:transcriptional regulator with GAF, ATPase, and Fis domain